VLCDRFADSTMAYQGYGRELGTERVSLIHEATLADFSPAFTLLLDLPVEVGLKRALARRDGEDRYENMDISFHERMRNGYLEIAKNDVDRIKIIDGSGAVEDVFDRVLKATLESFPALTPKLERG
ncbi:MAG: dTMP kinase, partial [Alphaproteobacteria bacterium]|nr:dTMP kinase [Alphaproteobacteria bacterium]